MLQRVTMSGLELPRLYIAENLADVRMARENGIPYVRWRHGQESLIKQLLRPAIEKMFPGIDWNKVLGERSEFSSNVVICHGHESLKGSTATIADYDAKEMLEKQLAHDEEPDKIYIGEDVPTGRTVSIADSKRVNHSDNSHLGYDAFAEEKLRIEDYVGDLSSSVNIEVLQELDMLPAFIGDITDCIKRNLNQHMRWTEGYNKKLGCTLGKFDNKAELPNLIIIDVSYSIPDGIAATMLTLADTLRSNLNAELIITSARSGYYACGDELPKPQTLREYYERSNESAEFMAILQEHIAGREFGYVISFGDYDCPGSIADYKVDMQNTKVHCVHNYHTGKERWGSSGDLWTGYAEWTRECCPDVDAVFNTSWCNIVDRNYEMGE